MSIQEMDLAAHLKEYESSGLTLKKYCSLNGLDYKAFQNYRFRQHYKQRTSVAKQHKSEFKEFQVGYELRLRVSQDGSLDIRGVDPNHLPVLLRAVGALSE